MSVQEQADVQLDQADDQVASQDEFEISLTEGVEDESLLEPSTAKKFSITSYGADYTVDSLVKRMKGGAFEIPEFQRRFVWSQKHASKFIESLLMGLPVPGIFLYRQADTNKHLVIDGQQRLKTLQAFYSGFFGENKFRLISVSDPWAGKTYEELDPADQLKLDDSIVHATIFTQDKPADVLDSIYFVFERINSGGIRLSPQEIRDCISAGPFISMAKELNKDPYWRKIFGEKPNKREKDVELIIRFFAMLEDRGNYSRPMAKFLNDYSSKTNKASPEHLKSLADSFKKAIKLVHTSLDGRAFRPAKTLNAAVFDATMVGIATRLRKEPGPELDAVAKAYNALLTQPDFKKSWERATADEESVKTRMDAAVKAFDAI